VGRPVRSFSLFGVESASEPERMKEHQAADNRQEAPAQVPTARFMRETGPAAGIAELVEPVLEDMGFRLVRVSMSRRDGGTIQIMADRAGGAINVDDCAHISRRISPLLDAHDPIEGRYFLEVSSPGIDRILVRPSDFEEWAGYEVKVELKELIDGRKRFRGILEGYEDGEMRLRVQLDEKSEPQSIGLPAGLIHDAKLVLTDELIRASLAKAKAAGQKWAEGGEVEEPDLKDSELNDGPNRD
jgi:ribosome maturation factor RimP